MWARFTEILLSIWLGLSPLFLTFTPPDLFLKSTNPVAAALIFLFAALSYNHTFRKAHLLTLPISIYLYLISYTTFPSIATFPLEHSAIIGFTLFMLSIVPTHTTQLSPSWHHYYQHKK